MKIPKFDYNREQIRIFEELSRTISYSREYRV